MTKEINEGKIKVSLTEYAINLSNRLIHQGDPEDLQQVRYLINNQLSNSKDIRDLSARVEYTLAVVATSEEAFRLAPALINSHRINNQGSDSQEQDSKLNLDPAKFALVSLVLGTMTFDLLTGGLAAAVGYAASTVAVEHSTADIEREDAAKRLLQNFRSSVTEAFYANLKTKS